jgi:ABC-type transporter MlaC component
MSTIACTFRRPSPLAAAALALAVLLAVPARPAGAAEDPSAFINKLGTQGIAMFQPNITSEQRLHRLGKLFRHDFDVKGIGLFALGRYRWQATLHEKHQYFILFRNFTVRAFSSRLSEYGGALFKITGQKPTDGKEIIVISELSHPGGTSPLQLQWFLKHKHGRYMVGDLVVGDVSMKIALRNQFAEWIEKNGGRFDSLLAVLKQVIWQLN